MVRDSELIAALPMLIIATATTHVHLAMYFCSRSPQLAALKCAALAWLFWGFYFVIGMWI